MKIVPKPILSIKSINFDPKPYWWVDRHTVNGAPIFGYDDARTPEVGTIYAMKSDGNQVPSTCIRGMHASKKVAWAASFLTSNSENLWRVSLGGLIDHEAHKSAAQFRYHTAKYPLLPAIVPLIETILAYALVKKRRIRRREARHAVNTLAMMGPIARGNPNKVANAVTLLGAAMNGRSGFIVRNVGRIAISLPGDVMDNLRIILSIMLKGDSDSVPIAKLDRALTAAIVNRKMVRFA